MTIAIGQTITKVITIRDNSNVPILGLLEDDFFILEAFRIPLPSGLALVTVDELDEGQYALSFQPSESGPWALHYVYDNFPIFLEDTTIYDVSATAEIVVVTAGGSWTYSGDLTDDSQVVRYLIQDVDGDHPLFTDSEVAYALGAASGSTRRAAASLVERLMARYAAMADTTELDLSVRASQIYEHYKDLLTSLVNPFSGAESVTPYAGGISVSDVMVNRQNTDRVVGVFDRSTIFQRRDWGGIR